MRRRILEALPFRVNGTMPRIERMTLIVLLVAVASIWSFVELADAVIEGETHAFDEAILLALRSAADPSDPIGPGWIEELGRDFTALGGVGFLTVLTLALKRRAMWLVIAAVGSGLLVSTLLKHGFDRPRPDLVPHGSIVYTASFPSGHSMMAAVTYLTLAALLARVQPDWRIKAYLLTLACLLTVAVGVSRVYLGVHWPTDVLAGWTAGAGWALIWWMIARWLQARGEIEQEGARPPDPPPPPAGLMGSGHGKGAG